MTCRNEGDLINNSNDRYKANKKSHFIAHRRESDGEIQDVGSHLEETSFFAGNFAGKIGLESHGNLLGLLHDLGKATAEFLQYIQSATGFIDPDEDDYIDAASKKGKIDHSSAGAQVIYHYLTKQGKEAVYAMQILPLIIASHHSGLIDCLSPDGNDNFSRRMKKREEKTRLSEAIANLDQGIEQTIELIMSNKDFIQSLNLKILSMQENNDSTTTFSFKIGLLVRFLFSCLIDADRLSTADFEFPDKKILRNHGKYTGWDTLIDRLNSYLNGFKEKAAESENQRKVNAIRNRISAECLYFANKEKGLYQLTVPTGGGKTLSSLRFALHHARKHKMDRIIYVIPYTSIIDQNAETARNVLEVKNKDGVYESNLVLEHHSNLTPDEESTRQKLLAENWDAPVVFTTMVQLLESLFGPGTRSARRMHQLANTVIIFDEIQTLPIRCIHLFNVAIRFLVKSCGSSVILCTATQPLLNKVTPIHKALEINPEQQMMSDVYGLFEELKRVEIFDKCKNGGWTNQEIVTLIEQEAQITGSALIVVNTKKSAINLFQLLQQIKPDAKIVHLSTHMCPAHRMRVLSDIKECLKNDKPIICISTQLIEAGVDVDFGSVIRYLAGLDSIAQAAGRCNRNGARPQKGRVLIVNPKEENVDNLPDIKIGRDITMRLLGEFRSNPLQFDGDIIGLKAMERYYRYYFFDRSEEMGYNVSHKSAVGRADSLFELLSANSLSVQEYQRLNNMSSPSIALRQSFMTASKAFRAIDSLAQGVIVPYEKTGCDIITQLCGANDLTEQYRLLKQAQRYSVNVFPTIFSELTKRNIIREVQPETGIYYLDKQYYSNEFGLSGSQVNEMEFLFYGGV